LKIKKDCLFRQPILFYTVL